MKPPEPVADQLRSAVDHRHLFDARDLCLGGLLGALGILVPIIFHALGLGRFFLPMYLPILALGLLANWDVALIVGVATPLLSGALTGMPPLVPIGVLMSFELAALAVVASLGRRVGLGAFPASLAAVVAARGVGAIWVLALGPLLGFQQGVAAYVVAAFAASWPGIALLLTVVPGAVYAVERASVIGRRH